RLDQMSESQKAELKGVLEPIWNIVAGSSLARPPDDAPLFSPRRWMEGVRAWASVLQACRNFVKLLAQHVDGPRPKQLATGKVSVSPQPPPAATTVVSPPSQTSATASPAVPKEQPNATNATKAR